MSVGGRLFQREDDRPESVKLRLEVYENSTAPRAARAGRRYWIARRNLRSDHECLGKTPRLAFVETGL
jgi:hypothetical protein